MDDPIDPYIFYGVNEISIIIIKNVESQSKLKHIDMQYHYIFELITNKEIEISWISSSSILADGFTKVLSINKFRYYQDLLKLVTS